MDTRARTPRDEASRFDAAVLAAAAATSGLMFFALLPETIRGLFGLTGADGAGSAGLVFMAYNGLAGVWFVQLLIRLKRHQFAWPTGWPFVANMLDSLARGWGIGLVLLDARGIADALAHFGAPSPNGSYIADTFFFLLVTLMLATPALAALWLARRVA